MAIEGSPAEADFLFEIDSEPLEECATALGGVPLLVRAIRSLNVPGSVQRHVRVKQWERGFEAATDIKSLREQLRPEKAGKLAKITPH